MTQNTFSFGDGAPRDVLSDQERLAWLQLSRTENIGPITFYRLLERFQTAEKALAALPEMARRGGRKKPFVALPKDEAERELEQIDKFGARLIARTEPDYPAHLAALEDAPPVITVKGHVHLLTSNPCLGVVGARNASLNGRKFAERIAREVGENGYTIVSGLARGLDTSAHSGSLDTGTAAIVAGGIDVIYPKENTDLYHDIAEQGVIIAESPFGTQPQARHFPRRNRIIAGLSLGVLVVEAALKSGSLITARLAGEQGREVFAVPGSPLDPRAQGTNKLIQDGAYLAQGAQDILDVLNRLRIQPFSEPASHFAGGPPIQENQIPGESEMEDLREKIMEFLSWTPIAVDEVVRECSFSTSGVLTALLELELAGRIERHPGNKVSRIE